MDQIKLHALDIADLQIISAHCQDAILKVKDIQYIPQRFCVLLEMNRFVWDHGGAKPAATGERRRAQLSFLRVERLRAYGIDRHAGEEVLSLLAMEFEVDSAPAGVIKLYFSGGGVLALHVECIELQLTDLGAAWQASAIPSHSGK